MQLLPLKRADVWKVSVLVSNGLDLHIPFIYFREIEVSWVKAYQISCLSSFQYTPLPDLMYKKKRLLNSLETRILFIPQKTIGKVVLYTNNRLKLQF